MVLICILTVPIAISVIASPQSTHFFACREQFIERSLGIDLAILENDDVVGTLQSGASMGDHEAGYVFLLEDTLP